MASQHGDRQTLASLVSDWERKRNDIAIVARRGLRSYATSYRKLAHLARRFAAELSIRGISKGDRVILWGENSAEWVAAFFGCVTQGVLPVPLDHSSPIGFVERVAADVAPKLIVASADQDKPAGERAPFLALETLADTITREPLDAREDLRASDPLQIIFTSGTTGEPKGVVHSHKNVLASLSPIEREMQKYLNYERIFHPIRILHSLPLSHVFGQFMGLWIPTLLTAEVHFEARLVPAELVARIHNQRISVLAAVPRVLELLQTFLLDRIPDLSDRLSGAQRTNALERWWKFRDVHRLLGFKFWAFVCGGASLPAEQEQFWRSLGFVVVQGYGMTETTALVSLNHPFRPVQGTIGQVLPGREVKLSEDGEVLVRGDTISTARWHRGEVREEGSDWLSTGDLAEFDESGNLRFRGRKKDVIVTSSGLNIYPEDLEAALAQQEAVKNVAVIEAQTDHGPEPLAVLVANEPVGVSAAVAAANRKLGDFQQIRRWLIWPEPDFPRTSTGKVLKREIARRIAAGEVTPAHANGNSTVELDSLGRVQLQAQLEQQLGITLDDAAIQNVKTEADLAQMVRQTPQRAFGMRAQHVYARWPWHPMQQIIRASFLELVAMPLVWFLGAPRVRSNVGRWPSQPMLIVANHITSYDAAFILYALPRHVRERISIAMSGEMLLDFRQGRNQGNWFLDLVGPIAYFLMTALFNVFPLPQYSGFRDSFRHAGEAMDRGYNVLVFPEGRRSDDGTPQAFKSGAGLLWKELGSPALPVHLSGLGELKAHGDRWFRSGKIGVTVEEVLPLDASASPEALTRCLERQVFRSHDPRFGSSFPAERTSNLSQDSAEERPSEHANSQ